LVQKLKSLQIKKLTAGMVRQWADLSPISTSNTTLKVLRSLREDQATNRFLVYQNDLAVARFSNRVAAKSLIVWWPTTSENIVGCDLPRLYKEVALFHCAFARDRQIDFMECTVKSDLPHLCEWRNALLSAGFQSIATKREWQLNRSKDRLQAAELLQQFRSTTTIPDDATLSNLYRRTLEESLDAELLIQASCGEPPVLQSSTKVILMNDRCNNIGLYVGDIGEDSRDAWTIFVGVIPEYRMRGAGTALLSAGLREIVGATSRIVRSLIDERNEASKALHRRCGFVPTDAIGEILARRTCANLR
jgi:hypothetical protein